MIQKVQSMENGELLKNFQLQSDEKMMLLEYYQYYQRWVITSPSINNHTACDTVWILLTWSNCKFGPEFH